MPRKPAAEKKTKAQVRETFQTLLKETEEAAKQEHEQAPVREEPAESYGIDHIVGHLSNVRITVGKYLSELEQQLVQEAERLQKARNAIVEQSTRLKQLHDIDSAAMSLLDLLQKQEEQRAAFQEETARARQAWEEEQLEHDKRTKERDETLKKERTREQEEYQYELKKNRQREKESFEQELGKARTAFEEETKGKSQELQSREEATASREKEFQELAKKVQEFPVILGREIKEAEKRAIKETEERFKMERLVLEKDIERERELFKMNTASLQDKIKEQDMRIKGLERDLKASMEQSHEVASKAIEGIAGIRTHAAAVERKVEGEKQD